MKLIIINCVSFRYDKKNNKLEKSHFKCLLYKKDSPQIIIINNQNFLPNILELKDKLIGFSEYKFRKGIGIKGEIQRLYFRRKTDKYVEFYRYKKVNRRLKVDENSVLRIPNNELKYIYPFVLSPDITKEKLKWEKTYVIFPYEYGEKYPVDEKTLKEEAPTLYNYLKSNRTELEKESDYNKRIQNKKEFYGVIRVGEYTYGSCFVAIRDNTKLVAQVVGKLKTDWGETKNPIFDNHISYLSRDIDGKPISCEKAKKIKEILNNPIIKQIIEGYYDSRSIGSRLPIKIEELVENGI